MNAIRKRNAGECEQMLENEKKASLKWLGTGSAEDIEAYRKKKEEIYL